MEDTRPIDPAFTVPTLRPRGLPTDVPQDVIDEDDFLLDHLNDPNFPLDEKDPTYGFDIETKKTKFSYGSSDDIDHSDRYSTSRASTTADDFDDESPYPEVRAAVPNTDNPNLPVSTVRMWMISLLWMIILPIFNTALGLRFPSVYITGLVIQLISLPMGRFLARVLPTRQFNTFGYQWTLNPGPFNIKEHTCITVMANVAAPGGFATDIFVAQRVFYNQRPGLAYQVLLTLGIQAYGYSLAGLMRRTVVYPSSMIWPGAIVNSALFNTLHKSYGKDRGHLSRERYFLIVFLGALVYYFFPGFLFTALSMFSWVCWIAPTNVTVNALFGASGLGMSGITFDWAMISYIASPMVTPWWAEANIIVSFVAFFWILTPIIYFTNSMYTAFLPISSFYAFDNTGLPYNASAVVTDGVFDLVKYKAYSPLFISSTLAVLYGLSFAIFPAIFVHTLLWYRRDIWNRMRPSARSERDVHYRLMQSYRETPSSWFAVVGIVAVVFIIIAIEIFDTKMPVWAALLAMLISAATAIPLAMIQAIANTQISLTVMYEMIFGFMLPGRPVGNVIFKSIGFMGSFQAASFASDLKLGQYMKIPPRIMFIIQTTAVVFTAVLSPVAQQWMFDHITGLCSPDQPQLFTCPSSTTFATSSLIWGGIGPDRIFGPDAPYRPLLWFFLLGVILPIPPYLLARRFPRSFWRYVNVPVMISGLAAIPPASGLNYISWGIVGFIFNYYIRRFHFRWWMRYNYITSAALDAGTVFTVVLIFLCLQLPKDGTISLNWWGNTVWMNTADSLGTPLKTSSTGVFGPSTWS